MGGREGRPCDHRNHRLRTARIGRRRIRRAAEAGSETGNRKNFRHCGIGESGKRDLCAGLRRSAGSERGTAQHSGKTQRGPARGGVAHQSAIDECERTERLDGRGCVRSVHRRQRQGSLGLMRYLPKSPAERQEMLAAIGAKSIEELFSSIPERFRLREPLKIPGPYSEAEVIQYFKERAAENSNGYTSFLGAGVYNHLRSVVTDAIIQRGEFLTSYTPYQAEITQGTLQAIFEFQTLMCQLTGQEVANASMYDGSTATTEAALMAERLTGRSRVLVARSVHPEYREVLQTYAKNSGLHVEEISYTMSGTLDAKALKAAIRDDVCAVVVQSPNFFGTIETLGPLAEITRAAGAMLVVAVAEAVSLER